MHVEVFNFCNENLVKLSLFLRTAHCIIALEGKSVNAYSEGTPG
jgi:hypothetical protein